MIDFATFEGPGAYFIEKNKKVKNIKTRRTNCNLRVSDKPQYLTVRNEEIDIMKKVTTAKFMITKASHFREVFIYFLFFISSTSLETNSSLEIWPNWPWSRDSRVTFPASISLSPITTQ